MKLQSPSEDGSFALQSGQTPIVRDLQALTGLNCSNQHHHRPPSTHPCMWVWGHPDLAWAMLELHLFPVLLLAVPALSLGFPTLTSDLTCYLTFCWIADCLTVSGTCHQPALLSQLRGCGIVPHWWWSCLVWVEVTPRFPTFMDQPQSPCWRNTELASLLSIDNLFGTALQGILPLLIELILRIRVSMWLFFILITLFTFLCKKSPFRKRKEAVQYFWSLE